VVAEVERVVVGDDVVDASTSSGAAAHAVQAMARVARRTAMRLAECDRVVGPASVSRST
jgi:hypothetical protein